MTVVDMPVPAAGDFVEVRTRGWLVESVTGGDAHVRAQLACIDDDAQGERLEVLWRDEVDASVIADGHKSVFENPGTDDPEVFSAYLRSIRWNTATAADRKLLQAPFRAGIHLDAYQLVPLAKALVSHHRPAAKLFALELALFARYLCDHGPPDLIAAALPAEKHATVIEDTDAIIAFLNQLKSAFWEIRKPRLVSDEGDNR